MAYRCKDCRKHFSVRTGTVLADSATSPNLFEFYIDYDAIARDLSVEFSETTIAGERFIYRCG